MNPELPTLIHSLRGTGRPWRVLLWLSTWAVLAAFSATIAAFGSSAAGLAVWFKLLTIFLGYWYAWAIASLVIHKANLVHAATGRSLFRDWPVHLLLFVAASVLSALAVGPDWRTFLYGDDALFFHGMNIPVYLLIALGSKSLLLYRANLDKERERAKLALRAARLEGQLVEARLDMLRAQIHPHILFNALNSIASLVRSGRADECYRMTELLASLLRSSLDKSESPSVLLDTELEFVSRYLELEAIRFRERLRWRIDASDESRFVEVAPFLVQPIVENAIKHAVEATSSPVCVVVDASVNGPNLVVSVSDDGPGLAANESHGVGLRNIRERLALIYGENGRLQVEPGKQGGVVATLFLPGEFPANGTAGPS